ncbi:MAG: hypothetical protein OJF61_002019 [Rhodanobacteraceae bacterium]|nr:MAG: hypothetical protein OJF61_002019 [Rhodanobacteraceae bacterium]
MGWATLSYPCPGSSIACPACRKTAPPQRRGFGATQHA